MQVITKMNESCNRSPIRLHPHPRQKTIAKIITIKRLQRKKTAYQRQGVLADVDTATTSSRSTGDRQIKGKQAQQNQNDMKKRWRKERGATEK